MKREKIYIFIIIILAFILGGMIYTYCTTYPFKEAEFEQGKEKYKEKDYVDAYCRGITEYRLPDRTRVDCLTDEYAIEFDWAKKWAESIGQAKYYAKMTGKKPAVAIIMKSPKDKRFIKRIEKADSDIKIFEIKSRDYKK